MIPTFDWTINLGNVLTFAGMAAGGMFWLMRLCARLDKIELTQALTNKADDLSHQTLRHDIRDMRLAMQALYTRKDAD